MNWGTKIAVSLGAFMAFIMSLGIWMVVSSNEKVEKDYYEKDLLYEQEIQAQRNTQKLSKIVRFELKESDLIVHFPLEVKKYTGQILLVRPDDAKKDRSILMKLNNQQQIIQGADLATGLWKIKAVWQMDGKAYQSKTFDWIKY